MASMSRIRYAFYTMIIKVFIIIRYNIWCAQVESSAGIAGARRNITMICNMLRRCSVAKLCAKRKKGQHFHRIDLKVVSSINIVQYRNSRAINTNRGSIEVRRRVTRVNG